MKKVYLLLVSILILLSSCVHKTPFVDEYYYQALGESGEIVVTTDVEKIKEGDLDEILDTSIKENTFVKRATRVSLSLLPSDEDESYVTSGAVEGNISSFVTNTALGLSSSFKKEKEEKIKWYSDSNISLYSPQNGVLLFTDGSFPELFKRSYTERRMLIDDETAELMASSAFSLYVFEPQTLIDLGFDITQAVIDEITQTCLLFNNRSGVLTLSGYINTTSIGTARALNTLFRNQLVQSIRRSGESLNTKALASIFTTDDSTVLINDYPLSGEMKEKAQEILSKGLGGLL